MRNIFTLIFSLIILFGCKSTENITPLNPISNPLKETNSPIPGVYVGGYNNNFNTDKFAANIWKNGDVNFASPYFSFINEIFISGKDIYAVGREFKGSGSSVIATIWKNGVSTTLGNKDENSVYGSNSSNATGIFVSGNDVYVCGVQRYVDFITKPNTGTVWKNGVAMEIESGTELSAIFVSESDVYTCGTGYMSGKLGVSFFKNGQKIYFAPNDGEINGLYVTGGDIYASGFGKDNIGRTVAKIWKNGIATTLADSKFGNVQANDIFISGNDIYVVGTMPVSSLLPFIPRMAVIWKNGIVSNLSEGKNIAIPTSVFVSGNDVYVSGYEYTPVNPAKTLLDNGTLGNGVIWKNGVKTIISKTDNILIPTSIFVAK